VPGACPRNSQALHWGRCCHGKQDQTGLDTRTCRLGRAGGGATTRSHRAAHRVFHRVRLVLRRRVSDRFAGFSIRVSRRGAEHRRRLGRCDLLRHDDRGMLLSNGRPGQGPRAIQYGAQAGDCPQGLDAAGGIPGRHPAVGFGDSQHDHVGRQPAQHATGPDSGSDEQFPGPDDHGTDDSRRRRDCPAAAVSVECQGSHPLYRLGAPPAARVR